MIVLASVFAVLFAGMAVVEGLSGIGVLPTGTEVWQMIFPPEPPSEYNLVYTAGKGGYLIGEDKQTVTEGEDASPVLAVADDGFMFYAWSDGLTTPNRTDEDVKKAITVNAVFIAVDDLPDDGSDEDEPDDAPGDQGKGQPGDEPSTNGGGSVSVRRTSSSKPALRPKPQPHSTASQSFALAAISSQQAAFSLLSRSGSGKGIASSLLTATTCHILWGTVRNTRPEPVRTAARLANTGAPV